MRTLVEIDPLGFILRGRFEKRNHIMCYFPLVPLNKRSNGSSFVRGSGEDLYGKYLRFSITVLASGCFVSSLVKKGRVVLER